DLAGDDAAGELPHALDRRQHLREPHALDAARARDLLVLLPRALDRRLAARRDAPDPGRGVPVLADYLHDVRGRLLLRDHAGRDPVDPARPDVGRVCALPLLLAYEGGDG